MKKLYTALSAILTVKPKTTKKKKEESSDLADSGAVLPSDTAEKPPKYTPLPERRRQTLMSDPLMRYAYDLQKNLWHDRECKSVAAIPTEHLCMQTAFPVGEPFCPNCVRKAMIRHGIGAQTQRINSYLHAINSFKAGTDDLFELFIRNKARLISVSDKKNAVCLQVGDDRWRIHRVDGHNCLYHNNYSYRGGTRVFYDDFHRQELSGADDSFACIRKEILDHKDKTYKRRA